jgi:hypothetical protein
MADIPCHLAQLVSLRSLETAAEASQDERAEGSAIAYVSSAILLNEVVHIHTQNSAVVCCE